MTNCSSVALAGRSEKVRWCETSMMLAPASASSAATAANWPGLSGISSDKLRQPPLARELARQHRGDQPRVDVAAAQDQTNLLAGEARGIGHDRRKARGAGALDDRLLDRDQGRDCALELGFADERDVVDQAADDFRGDLARRS